MRTQSKTKQTAQSAGKRGRPNVDLFYFRLSLVERVARVFWTNPKAKENKSIPDYFRHSIENCSQGLSIVKSEKLGEGI